MLISCFFSGSNITKKPLKKFIREKFIKKMQTLKSFLLFSLSLKKEEMGRFNF